MSKAIVRRLEKMEQPTFLPRWRVAVSDIEDQYRTDDGQVLNKKQFDAWADKLRRDKDTQIILVEVVCNLTGMKLKIENHVDKNTTDLLKEYDAIIRKSAEIAEKSFDSKPKDSGELQ